MQTDPAQLARMVAMQELAAREVLPDLFERSTTQLYVFDAETLKLAAANAAARDAMGLDLRGAIHRTPWELRPDFPKSRLCPLFKRARQRSSQKIEFAVSRPGHDGYCIAVTIYYLASNLPTYVVNIRDITRQTRYRDDARKAEQTLETAINALSDGFVLYDADDRLILCNETYRALYDKSAAAMSPGTTFEEILRYGLDRGQYLDGIGREEEWLAERLAAHRSANNSVEQQLDDGTWLRIVERMTPDGGRVGLRVNVTALKEQQQRLNTQLLTDDLTGLRNRRNLAREIAALVPTLRDRERIAVLNIDLTRFKAVNDVFGHDAGDFVLRYCAGILSGGRLPPQIAARVGGDEFVLVLVTRKAAHAIKRHAMALIKRIQEPISFDSHLCNVGASIGIAFVNGEKELDAAQTLTAANIALNHAIRDQALRVAIFRPEMREQTLRNNVMAQNLQEGLQRGEFVPFFQPQLNARTNRIKGFEALVRWIRQDGQTVPADQFLAVAQKSGLTTELDDIVMDQSCRAVRDMLRWGVRNPCVSLNMSMDQISDPNLLKRLNDHMRRHGIAHEHLRIELLESTLLDEQAANIVDNVHKMIDAGFQVELDDFGTGHAAIATLRKFDVSQIKIDRSLVRHIDRDENLKTITGAIIDLAQNLGISVLAEGVETQAEQDTLLAFNCDTAQGYLHARPMPLAELHQYLSDRGDINGDAATGTTHLH